jgi:hypothetical protein
MAKPGAGLVLAGPNQPGEVHLLAYAINAALKNLGQTLVVRQIPRNPRTIDISQLAADMNDGWIKQLFILGGDPVYNAPRGLIVDPETGQPLDWSDLQKKSAGDCAARLSRGFHFGAEPVARSCRTLPGILG